MKELSKNCDRFMRHYMDEFCVESGDRILDDTLFLAFGLEEDLEGSLLARLKALEIHETVELYNYIQERLCQHPALKSRGFMLNFLGS